MRKLVVKQISEKTYEDPTLTFTINLPMGPGSSIPEVIFKYTCSDCGGYGCHGKICDDFGRIEVKNLRQSLGDEQTDHLIMCLNNFITKCK